MPCQSPAITYFSTQSGNTRRFVERLPGDHFAIPRRRADGPVVMDRPYVLVTPTYGDGNPRTCVPSSVIRFLNNPTNRQWLRGVVAGGNTNFGNAYGLAGDVIAHKCQVPLLYKFELMGTSADVECVTHLVTTELLT